MYSSCPLASSPGSPPRARRVMVDLCTLKFRQVQINTCAREFEPGDEARTTHLYVCDNYLHVKCVQLAFFKCASLMCTFNTVQVCSCTQACYNDLHVRGVQIAFCKCAGFNM